MEPLSPRSPSTPTSPRRHIHSSFPHYFYSTPATPSGSDSSSLSAFVVLCESSRLRGPPPAPKSNSDAAEFAFGSNRSASFDVAFAEDIFREGRLLPVGPQPAPAPPLKPPPRLQYVANIRKSLRVRRRLQAWAVAGRRRKKDDDDDPFVVAVEKVTREDAPWCQLPRGRRPEVRGTDGDEAVKAKRRGMVACVKSAISTKDKRSNGALLSKEESAWLISKSGSSKAAGHGELVGLAGCTTVSSYRNTHYGSSLLACFGFK